MRLFALLAGIGSLAATVAHAACPADVKSLVCLLPNNYNPALSNTYLPPPATCDQATDDQKNAIQDAFENAPRQLKIDLCSLKQIFIIIDANKHSWGKWEDPNQRHGPSNTPGSGDAFIAIHVGDLNKTLSDKQDEHFRGLGISSGIANHKETIIGSTKSQTLALLYVLAHEMGTSNGARTGSNL